MCIFYNLRYTITLLITLLLLILQSKMDSSEFMNNIPYLQHTYKTYKSIKLTSYLNDNDLVDKRQIAFRKYLNTLIMLSLFDDLYAVSKSTPNPL